MKGKDIKSARDYAFISECKKAYTAMQRRSDIPQDLKKDALLVLENILQNGLTEQSANELKEMNEIIDMTVLSDKVLKISREERKVKDAYLKLRDVKTMISYINVCPYIDARGKELLLKLMQQIIKLKGDITQPYKESILDFFEKLIEGEDEITNNMIDKDIQNLRDEENNVIEDDEDTKEQKENFYVDFISSKVKDKQWLDKQIIYKIHKTPTKSKDNTHYKATDKNAIHQIDILFLPSDNQFKYLLVICDVYSGLIDGEPMRNKNSDVVLKATQKIYKRKLLEQPYRYVCDSGSEFKSVFKEWCEDNHIILTSLESGKHIGIIDTKIKMIGNAVIKMQTSQELLTKKEKTGWVEDIHKIIELINKYTTKKGITHEVVPYDEKFDIPDTIYPDEIIPVGTKVRKILFKPKNAIGKSLIGDFRAADIRFEPEISTITNILFTPDAPVMYLINDSNQPFNRHEFELVNDNEEMPPKNVLKNKKTYLKEFEDELKKKK